MPRLIILLLLLGILVWMSMTLIRGRQSDSPRHRLARARVERANDLAWQHDDISEALAGAIIERTRGLRPESSLAELERAIDDVLDLARLHREQEPHLATLVIDVVRSRELE